MNSKSPYNSFHRGSAILMVVALLWLTLCIPFVYEQQKKLAKQSKLINQSSLPSTEEESGNPLGNNNTEEKTPNSLSTLSEEYLHDHHRSDHFFCAALQYSKNGDAEIYIAYHGEPLVPPPNIA